MPDFPLRPILTGLLLASIASLAGGCGIPGGEATRIEPTYDRDTGRLELLRYDANGDGNVDTWSYMNGADIVRIEIDTNRDGTLDRWEYYSQGAMVRAEEDTSQDGLIDKWEVYEGSRLQSVAFDTTRSGYPDRRLTYGPDGSARAEALGPPPARQ